jgi:hypothetical protein
VVVCSNRPENLARVVANLARLDYPRLEVGFVAHGAGFDLGPLVELCQERGYPLRHTRAPESLNIGQVRQLSHELSSGTWLAKLDDDDHYGPGYVRDGVWQARMGSAAMVVKGAPIVEFEGESRLQAAPVTRHFRYLMSPGAGGMLLRRDVALGIGVRPVERWEDRGLVLDFARAGMPILCSDPFNYVYRRGRAGGHNWELERSEVIAAMSLEVAGENLRAGDFCF